MRTSQKLILFTAFVAVCLLPAVLSIKCFVCNNLNDRGCGHGKDVDRAHIKDCDTEVRDDGQHGGKFTLCRKIVTWIDFDVNNNTATERIVRKCGYIASKYDNDCYYRGGFGGRQRVCTCQTDDCNSGFSISANQVMVVVASSLLLLVFRSQN